MHPGAPENRVSLQETDTLQREREREKGRTDREAKARGGMAQPRSEVFIRVSLWGGFWFLESAVLCVESWLGGVNFDSPGVYLRMWMIYVKASVIIKHFYSPISPWLNLTRVNGRAAAQSVFFTHISRDTSCFPLCFFCVYVCVIQPGRDGCEGIRGTPLFFFPFFFFFFFLMALLYFVQGRQVISQR